MLNSNHDRT